MEERRRETTERDVGGGEKGKRRDGCVNKTKKIVRERKEEFKIMRERERNGDCERLREVYL